MKGSFLKNALFPPRCARCDNIPESLQPLCRDCRSLLLKPDDPKRSCDICFFLPEKCICSKHQYIRKLSASFHYEGDIRRTVFRLKFRSRRDIAKNFAEVMLISLTDRDMIANTDIITFIPMSKYARFKRGYNQSELIANHLSRMTGKPCIPLLYKCGKTVNQHDLKSLERTGNLLGIFEPEKEHIATLKNKRILLVDDVSTTGSTFNEAAKTLLIFGAAEISAAAFTVTKKIRKKH